MKWNEGLFSIGEVAKLYDLNIRTLRYYDQIGLLKPERIDENSGYRYYSSRQFERLNTIKYLRALDMPLERIAQFFESRDVDTLVELLRQQQERTQTRLEELKRIDLKIKSRLDQIRDAVDTTFDQIAEVHFDRRTVAFLRQEIPVGNDLEYPIRELERQNDLDSSMFLGKVGVSVSEENLRERRFDSFSGIFVFVEEGDDFRGEPQYLKESDYLTIRFSGTHEKSGEYYETLLDRMTELGTELNGDSVEITLIDYGITNDQSKFVTELQVPIRKDFTPSPASMVRISQSQAP